MRIGVLALTVYKGDLRRRQLFYTTSRNLLKSFKVAVHCNALVFKEYDQVSRISRSCEYHILQRYLLNCVSIPVYYYNPSVGSPGGTWSLPGWCSWCGVIRPAAATPHAATLLSHITLKEGDSVSLPQAASQTQCNL